MLSDLGVLCSGNQDRLVQVLSAEKCARDGTKPTRDWDAPILHMVELSELRARKEGFMGPLPRYCP